MAKELFYVIDFTSCKHTQWIRSPCVRHVRDLGG